VTTIAEKFLRWSALAALLVWPIPASAKITQIIIDRTTTPTVTGTIPYEALVGRAFGELDPADPHNTIITDITFGTDPDGKVRYVTSFQLVKPKDMSQASGFMWHDVPNRGGRITIAVAEQNLGDVGLSSGWQSDNAGATSVPANASATTPQPALANNEWVKVPFAKNLDGSRITGTILGRIVNRSGPNSAPLNVMGNPIPYLPATLDTTQAVLTTRFHETLNGVISQGSTIPSSDWAFAHCDATHPFPGTPQDLDPTHLPGSLPVHVCLKNGFDPTLLYELVYPVANPYVLGVGMAAFRDLNSFFHNDMSSMNPVAGKIRFSAIRGVSQSGNFTRAFIHLGFNQDERNRTVHDGAWPIIAGRRVSLDSRWAQPDGVLELYEMGSEGPQWWGDFPDRVRHLPTTGILARCTATNSCPKVIEHFGGSEVFALKMTTEWVGTSADVDIPLPDNVRRYYVPSTTHGGGGGGFSQNVPANQVNCPGNNWLQGRFRANPVSEAQITNVIRLALRAWVMNGTPPPPSRWPRLSNGTLVDPTPEAMGFPKGIPGIPETVFTAENFVNPVLDYQWGPFFNRVDATGVPTDFPPQILHVIKMKVPRVDSDGNELGGVPTVLRDAPLGTYLGWNVTAAGFHQAQVCDYIGGMIPFAVTKAQRTGPDVNVRFRVSANGRGDWSRTRAVSHDPRPSLQERYGDHEGYVAAVTNAADNAVAQGYLLQADADALIAQASASDVLNSTTDTSVHAFGEINIGTGSDRDDDGDDDDEGESGTFVKPGDTVQVTYSFSLPGKHASATISFSQAQAIVQAVCHRSEHHRGRAPLIVNIPDASFTVAQNSAAPISSTAFSMTVPDFCQGGAIRLRKNGTFTAMVASQ
jgi:hypothetical protein